MAVWYSYNGKKYKGKNPPYYDFAGIAWYEQLKQELPVLRRKVLTFLKLEGLDIKEYFHTSLVDGTRWDALTFMFWKYKDKKAIDIGSDVYEYFKDIPGIVSVNVSILQPKTRIKGHCGDTDAIYRFHIPIYIPAQLPDCGLTVDGITRPWVEDDIIAFCDAHFHEAWNMTDEPRIIMIIDVVKDEFLSQVDKICANVLSSLAYQRVFHKLKFAKIFPSPLRNLIRVLVFLPLVRIYFRKNR